MCKHKHENMEIPCRMGIVARDLMEWCGLVLELHCVEHGVRHIDNFRCAITGRDDEDEVALPEFRGESRDLDVLQGVVGMEAGENGFRRVLGDRLKRLSFDGLVLGGVFPFGDVLALNLAIGFLNCDFHRVFPYEVDQSLMPVGELRSASSMGYGF